MEQPHFISLSTYSETLALSTGSVAGVRVLVSGTFLNTNCSGYSSRGRFPQAISTE